MPSASKAGSGSRSVRARSLRSSATCRTASTPRPPPLPDLRHPAPTPGGPPAQRIHAGGGPQRLSPIERLAKAVLQRDPLPDAAADDFGPLYVVELLHAGLSPLVDFDAHDLHGARILLVIVEPYPSVHALVQGGLLPCPEHSTKDAADLPERRLRLHGREDVGHRVRLALRGLLQPRQRLLPLRLVPRRPDLPQPGDLAVVGLLRHPERLYLVLLVLNDEVVHPDDDALPVLDLPLVAVRGVRDFLLEPALLDGGNGPALGFYPGEVLVRLVLHRVRQRLQVVRAAEGVDRVGDPRLVGEDLLRAQRDAHRLLVRHLVGLVVGVRVEGLRPAEDPGERLEGGADDVHLGLLLREGHAGGLRVEPAPPRPRALGAERLPHLPRPDAPRLAELC